MHVVPAPADPTDATRWAHTALIRRILDPVPGSSWEEDVRKRLQASIGDVRRQAWGPIDLSAAPLVVIADQLSRTYDSPPAIEAADPAGAELVQAIRKSGHWAQMQTLERDAWALGEVLVRVDVDRRGRPTYRPVYGDRVVATPDYDHPNQPVVLAELQRRTVPGGVVRDDRGRYLPAGGVWAWDVFDLTDPTYPTYKVVLDEGGKPTGVDLTAFVLGADQSGDAYPYRDAAGEPLIPYAIYRPSDSGRLWNTYKTRPIVEGTLTLATYYTFFGHILRACSWPQRYGVNVDVSGTSHTDEEGHGSGRQALVADPATVVMLRSLAAESGQPLVGQWQPGGDPRVVIEAIGIYEQRLAAYAGIVGSDQMRMSGDPRSGFAIHVARSTLREQMRRTEPNLMRADEELLRITAALVSRATGKRYPESGYVLAYQGVPISPEERSALRLDVLERLDKGLLDRVSAFQELNPGTNRADATKAIEEIARINRLTAI